MRTKHTFRLPPALAGKLSDFAAQKRVPQALVVETALASYLSPDGSERLEAAQRHHQVKNARGDKLRFQLGVEISYIGPRLTACARASGASKCCVQNENMGCKVVTFEMSGVRPCLGLRAGFQSR